MKKIKRSFAVALTASLFFAATAFAEQAKTYQVTGPVLEVTEGTITVQKGEEKWQISRDKSTKGAAGVKVGDKVTIQYRMVAADVEVKAEKAEKSEKSKKK